MVTFRAIHGQYIQYMLNATCVCVENDAVSENVIAFNKKCVHTNAECVRG